MSNNLNCIAIEGNIGVSDYIEYDKKVETPYSNQRVQLLHHTPLEIADQAIGKCWDKPPGDSVNTERMERVANKFKHASTIEHLVYSFDITMSRACLQEMARHRIASISVKSTRYTLKELKDTKLITDDDYYKYIIKVSPTIDVVNMRQLDKLQDILLNGMSNDKAKYCLPEAYKTSLVWTVNARSLQNFLALRTSKSALWEIREIAYAIYYQIPKAHRFLFKDLIT
jgi:thymidylate synthase (FAD)